ncbi:MAG TPA: Fe-S-containing protein [Bryobacteraceae bacterium]|nr:Fe-S-containing protein [Bryobacteraceae bacterium]
MLATLVIALREGVEAALVIAIAIAYLRKIGRGDLLPSVYKAFGAAVFASFLVAAVLSRFDVTEERYEGPLLLASAVFVFSMVLWMNHHSRGLKGQIETRLQQGTSDQASRWGIFLFVFLMVFREGVEAVLMLSALRFDNSDALLQTLGTVLGLGLAILFGVSFVRGTIRIDLGNFFRMTTVILMVVVLQLTITGLHELSEAQILPGSTREMALVGPIVRNEAFFFVTILALAATMLLMEWRRRRTPDAGNLKGAGLRKAKWSARRERMWMLASCSAAALFMLTITAEFIYAKSATELSTAVPITVTDGFARIPVSTVSDGMLHRFSIQSDGTTVRIIAIQRPDQSIAVAFDACQICGSQGYYQNGRNVICKNCASAINIPTIGQQGGCNPIPLESSVQGGQLVIPAGQLLAGSRHFVGRSR